MKQVCILIFIAFFVSLASNAKEYKGKKHKMQKRNGYTHLTLKLFIEGYYVKGGKMKPVLRNQHKSTQINIVDTILVRVHSMNYPYRIIASRRTLLFTNGKVRCQFKRIKGRHYISVKSRNGIEIWSTYAIKMNGQMVMYDFSKSDKQAFGTNMTKVEEGVWAFFSGDVNQDGIIDFNDFMKTEKDIMNFLFGFFPTDMNGDENVDLLDREIIERKLDVNKDKEVNALDFEMIKENPSLQIKVRRPMKPTKKKR